MIYFLITSQYIVKKTITVCMEKAEKCFIKAFLSANNILYLLKEFLINVQNKVSIEWIFHNLMGSNYFAKKLQN